MIFSVHLSNGRVRRLLAIGLVQVNLVPRLSLLVFCFQNGSTRREEYPSSAAILGTRLRASLAKVLGNLNCYMRQRRHFAIVASQSQTPLRDFSHPMPQAPSRIWCYRYDLVHTICINGWALIMMLISEKEMFYANVIHYSSVVNVATEPRC